MTSELLALSLSLSGGQEDLRRGVRLLNQSRSGLGAGGVQRRTRGDHQGKAQVASALPASGTREGAGSLWFPWEEPDLPRQPLADSRRVPREHAATQVPAGPGGGDEGTAFSRASPLSVFGC